jgi:hypothetical protein
MKHDNLLYWSVTGLMAAFMLMASIPDILRLAEELQPATLKVRTCSGAPYDCTD